MNNLDAIYVDVDDFCLLFEPQWLKHLIESGEKQRIKPSRLSSSEVMTILIAFHQSGYRDFKTYYTKFVCQYWRHYFPDLVSYTRMLKLLQATLPALCSYLKQRFDKPTGIAFIDSTLSRCVTTCVFLATKFSREKPSGVKEQWAGFMGLNFTSS